LNAIMSTPLPAGIAVVICRKRLTRHRYRELGPFAMKAIWDRVLQVIVLIIATGLTIVFELDKEVQSKLPSGIAAHIDEKTVIPITSGLVYVVLFLLITVFLKVPAIRKRMDKKFIYSGRYLSMPSDPDEIGVFEIKSGFFDTKYRLVGHSYLLSDLRPTGGWISEVFDLKPEGRLTYIYSGHEIDQSSGTKKFDGHGYANIQLLGPEREEGSGFWIDDKSALVRKDSRYVKLTRANSKRIKRGQGFFKRFIWLFVWPDRSIIAAFRMLPVAVKNSAPFLRPTSQVP
jgi:hypothetical protein